MTARYHIAQYNIARLRKPLDDAANADFVNNLDRINGLGDATAGFVWRHQAADGNSTSIRVRDDERIIINFTVWESIEQVWNFAFHTAHAEMYRRRAEWFEKLDSPYSVLWWIPAGHIPSVDEAEQRLDHLIAHGPTAHAFTLRQRFVAPVDAESIEAGEGRG